MNLNHFNPLNVWAAQTSTHERFLVDQAAAIKYTYLSPNEMRLKALCLTFATPFFQIVEAVANIAFRVLRLLSFYHFWKQEEGPYSFTSRSIETGKDALRLTVQPFAPLALELISLYGLIKPYDARKLYSNVEDAVYGPLAALSQFLSLGAIEPSTKKSAMEAPEEDASEIDPAAQDFELFFKNLDPKNAPGINHMLTKNLVQTLKSIEPHDIKEKIEAFSVLIPQMAKQHGYRASFSPKALFTATLDSLNKDNNFSKIYALTLIYPEWRDSELLSAIAERCKHEFYEQLSLVLSDLSNGDTTLHQWSAYQKASNAIHELESFSLEEWKPALEKIKQHVDLPQLNLPFVKMCESQVREISCISEAIVVVQNFIKNEAPSLEDLTICFEEVNDFIRYQSLTTDPLLTQLLGALKIQISNAWEKIHPLLNNQLLDFNHRGQGEIVQRFKSAVDTLKILLHLDLEHEIKMSDSQDKLLAAILHFLPDRLEHINLWIASHPPDALYLAWLENQKLYEFSFNARSCDQLYHLYLIEIAD